MIRIIYQILDEDNFMFCVHSFNKKDFSNLEQVHRINYPYANCFYVLGD